MKDKVFTIGVFVLLILSVTLNVFQQCTINKAADTLKDMQEIMHLTDSTLVIETDTIWMEKRIVEAMPKQKTETIMALDTVYQQKGDSIEATPRLLTLKKKIIPRQ